MLKDPPAPQSHLIGKHTIVTEGHIVLCYYVGPVSLDEIVAVHQILETALKAHRFVYQILDFRTRTAPTVEIRRWIAQWTQTHSLRAVVFFGAKLAERMYVTLMQNTIRLIKGNVPLTIFVQTEQEARAFVEADLRQQR